MTLVVLLTGLWFAAAFALSFQGWFEQFSAATLFGAGSVVAPTGFAIAFYVSRRFRRYCRSRDLRGLTRMQALRFFGTLALIKYQQGVLPALFAIPTGLMDLVLAGTSFFVAARMVAEGGRVLRGFVVWHQLGLASLGVSALTAVLTSTARYGETHAGITSQPMTQFPMSLVPIFIGPLVLICHLLALTTERGILESEQEMEKTRVS